MSGRLLRHLGGLNFFFSTLLKTLSFIRVRCFIQWADCARTLCSLDRKTELNRTKPNRITITKHIRINETTTIQILDRVKQMHTSHKCVESFWMKLKKNVYKNDANTKETTNFYFSSFSSINVCYASILKSLIQVLFI